MKLTAAVTTLVFASFTYAASIAKRQPSACYSGATTIVNDRNFVKPLADACLSSTNKTVDQFWNNKVCVAAAVAASPGALRDDGTCGAANESTVPSLAALPHLEYSVYAEIVGSCAYDEGGCPITRQNFVDLIYGAVSQENTTVYPDTYDILNTYYIQRLFDWTNTSDTVPYTNFDDWLHYSGYTSHF